MSFAVSVRSFVGRVWNQNLYANTSAWSQTSIRPGVRVIVDDRICEVIDSRPTARTANEFHRVVKAIKN